MTDQPHERNLGEWRSLVDRGDLPGIKHVLTGLGHREVIVVGSQAILGTFCEEDLPAAATMSIEVDILLPRWI